MYISQFSFPLVIAFLLAYIITNDTIISILVGLAVVFYLVQKEKNKKKSKNEKEKYKNKE